MPAFPYKNLNRVFSKEVITCSKLGFLRGDKHDVPCGMLERYRFQVVTLLFFSMDPGQCAI